MGLAKELGGVGQSIHFSASSPEQPSFPTRAAVLLKIQNTEMCERMGMVPNSPSGASFLLV